MSGDLLSIGASGVRAYQSALNVVGENIANASTDGYARREVALREITPGAKAGPLEIANRILGGVYTKGIDREWDAFRAADVRTANGELSRTEAGIVWLERVEGTLDGNDLSAQMTRFFNGMEAIAADPTGTGPRAALIETADALAASFRQTGEGLASIAEDLSAEARRSVTELNGLAASLATTNAGLSRAQPGSNAQAQLMDERDRLIDKMSQLAAVTVQMDDRGIATVRLNETNGPILVQASNAKTITVDINASGALAMTLDPFGQPQPLTLKSGSIAGLADAAIRVSDARQRIDSVATDFADAVNANQAGGADLDGNAGAPLFATSGGAAGFTMVGSDPRRIAAASRWTVNTPATNGGNGSLSAASDPSGSPLPALRFSVAGGVLSAIDPATNNVVGTASYTAGTPVSIAGLSVTVTGSPADGDSFGVALTAANSRDNGNLMALRDIRRSGNFEGAVTGLVTANASTLAARKSVADAQTAIKDGALAARDQVSGVNLDAEAVDLIRFQQAYQASSRVIQVARELFDTILQAA